MYNYAKNTTTLPIDMTLTENPLGCSPRVIEAITSITPKKISSYPSPNTLITTLAKQYSILPEQITVDAGSEPLIRLLLEAYRNMYSSIIIQRASFGVFTTEAKRQMYTIRMLNTSQIEQIKNTYSLIILCSPNNPTGECIPNNTLLTIIRNNTQALIVIDEANAEFAGITHLPFAKKFNNVLLLKSFSKGYGLAGIRIGYAVGTQKIITNIKKEQLTFPVSRLSYTIADCVVRDQAFLKKTQRYIQAERLRITNRLTDLGCTVSKSVTSNIYIYVKNAQAMITNLQKQGVSVISGSYFPGMEQEGFRISIRDKKTNTQFLEVFEQIISCTRDM